MEIIKPLNSFGYRGGVPSDKSITHRAVMLLSIADQPAVVKNALMSLDTLATIECMQRLGAEISRTDHDIYISPITAFRDGAELYAANSGTTMRLLTGLIAPRHINAVIRGDASLTKRPMGRVAEPLKELGASVTTTCGCAPIMIQPADMVGGEIFLKVKSAQVKSAVLLSGLAAKDSTVVHFDVPTRDHTERMLTYLGADIRSEDHCVTVHPSKLTARNVTVCGDISAAAFLMAFGAVYGNVYLENVGVNPTRAGILRVFDLMGIAYKKHNTHVAFGEDVCDLQVMKSDIRPVSFSGDIIANIIDELPIIAVLMSLARGKSKVAGAEELRVKESNRIELIVKNLCGLGVRAEETADGFVIDGTGEIAGNENFVAETRGDHRIAMSMSIAAALSARGATVDDIECAEVSYPDFKRFFQ